MSVCIFQKHVDYAIVYNASQTKNALSDSLAANPAGSITLTQTIATWVIKPRDKPQSWYTNPDHCQAFASIHPDKFRKRFRKLCLKNLGPELLNVRTHLSFLINFFSIFMVTPDISILRSKNTSSHSLAHVDENSNEIGDIPFSITIMWPSTMSSVPELMQRSLTGQDGPEMKDSHPKIQGFYSFVQNSNLKKVTLFTLRHGSDYYLQWNPISSEFY